MKDKKQILSELDAAIDAMNMDEINNGLDALSNMESCQIMAEDAKLFSDRIKKLHKENTKMNSPRKTIRIAVAVAAVMLMGLTVYAATTMNLFSFLSGDRFVTMRTTESMNEQDAKSFVDENENTPVPDGIQNDPTETKDIPIFEFTSVEQAQEEMDMRLILPSVMPEMKLDSVTGQTLVFSDTHESRTIWLTYSDDQGRLFGITTDRDIIASGESVTGYTTHDIDDGSLGKYKSKSGIEYTTLTESDETGEKTAHIATTMIGEYEYSLVFMGFSESERQAIIDSADLSAYQK